MKTAGVGTWPFVRGSFASEPFSWLRRMHKIFDKAFQELSISVSKYEIRWKSNHLLPIERRNFNVRKLELKENLKSWASR